MELQKFRHEWQSIVYENTQKRIFDFRARDGSMTEGTESTEGTE